MTMAGQYKVQTTRQIIYKQIINCELRLESDDSAGRVGTHCAARPLFKQKYLLR